MLIIKPMPWRFMMTQRIERVDTIPLINAMLVNMGVEKVIDNIFKPHGKLEWAQLRATIRSVCDLCFAFSDPSVVEYGILGDGT